MEQINLCSKIKNEKKLKNLLIIEQNRLFQAVPLCDGDDNIRPFDLRENDCSSEWNNLRSLELLDNEPKVNLLSPFVLD